MVEDRLVMKQNLKEINEYDIEYKFFPHFYKKRRIIQKLSFFLIWTHVFIVMNIIS